jgi:hypothetical protein
MQDTHDPSSASQIAFAVPSPPSAAGRQEISKSRLAEEPERQPSAIAAAASCAESDPLNLSGATRTCISRKLIPSQRVHYHLRPLFIGSERRSCDR